MSAAQENLVRATGPWTHRDVSANGARFHVAEQGQGPLVLLLHGFPEFWWAWRNQLGSLSAAGYRAVAVDLRGYGGSDKPPRGYDPFTLSLDVAGLVRALGERDAVLVGHGWGGFLGWVTAALHPEVVRRLAVVSMPHPRRLRAALMRDVRQLRSSAYALGFQLPWVPERSLAKDDGALVGRLLRSWAAPGWPDDETAATYAGAFAIPGVAHCSLEYHRWAVRSIPRPDGIRFAARMRAPIWAPVLHVHGELDGTLRPSSAAGSWRYVRAPYRWRLLKGVGHFPPEEAPARFDAELLGWLTDPPTTAAPRNREPAGRDRDPAGRDRDPAGRARNARPRDAAGRPLRRGEAGVDRVPEDVVLPPHESLTEAERLLAADMPFHAHEVLEGSWKAAPETERELWKGLAQVAVGLTHAQRGNAVGASRLLRRGAEKVAAYRDDAPHGVDAAGVATSAERLAAAIEADGLDQLESGATALRLRIGSRPAQ